MKVYSCEECVVCLNEPAGKIAFEPCLHACACTKCADDIRNLKLACPICRAEIKECVAVTHETEEIDKEVLEKFVRVDRRDYMIKIKRPLASNAGMCGKGKFAKAVASYVGNEMALRMAENKGTDRLGAGKKALFKVIDETLYITFKTGRRTLKEQCSLVTHDEVHRAIREFVGEDGITALDLATHNPDLYWLLHHHSEGDVEEELGGLGCLKSNRRRK